MGVEDMFNGNFNPEVQERFDKLKDYMSDKGNYICDQCGAEMVIVSGCATCTRCGGKDCGTD